MGHLLEKTMLETFREELEEEEKATATIEKYVHDVSVFLKYMAGVGVEVNKGIVIEYKEYLIDHYAAVSVNSMLAALNAFLKKLGWHDCVVKSLKIQKEAFRTRERDLTKTEYYQLLEAARKRKNTRLYWVMQVLCSTGIRISELKYITVESLIRGQVEVNSKGKRRTVLLPSVLCKKLKKYVKEQQIEKGSLFITRSGRPMDRSNHS